MALAEQCLRDDFIMFVILQAYIGLQPHRSCLRAQAEQASRPSGKPLPKKGKPSNPALLKGYDLRALGFG
jgi:hypothetical protein